MSWWNTADIKEGRVIPFDGLSTYSPPGDEYTEEVEYVARVDFRPLY